MRRERERSTRWCEHKEKGTRWCEQREREEDDKVVRGEREGTKWRKGRTVNPQK